MPVAEIKTMSWSGAQADTEDVSNMDSPNAYKESVVTMLDSGEVSLSGNRISGDAGQTAFNTAYGNRAKISCKIELPIATAAGQTAQGDVYTFDAWVTQPTLVDLQYDKAITFSAKVKITGPVTLALGN